MPSNLSAIACPAMMIAIHAMSPMKIFVAGK
jgi:hypothetical protein